MTLANTTILVAAAVLAYVVWLIDSRLLRDLASTPDHQLQRFDRRTWAVLILFSFPIGPMLYLMHGKGGPRRYS